jgi:hypothetical protein
MLPDHLWQPQEPRFAFPVFADRHNRLSYSLGYDLVGSRKVTAKRFLSSIKRRQGIRWYALQDLFALRPPSVRIRGSFLTRDGTLVRELGEIASLTPGGSFDISINALLEGAGVEVVDGMFLVVMSRGRRDAFDSSPGSFSMTYENEHSYTCYRTGAFGRVLNDVRVKRHSGFMSVNPKVLIDDDHTSSVMLINHSSWTGYDETVEPTVDLLRPTGEKLSAPFGPVPPFGGVEQPLEALFPEARDFLAPSGGYGMSVTHVKGASLAGLSLTRSRDGRLMAIEHTRPTQAYLVNGA